MYGIVCGTPSISKISVDYNDQKSVKADQTKTFLKSHRFKTKHHRPTMRGFLFACFTCMWVRPSKKTQFYSVCLIIMLKSSEVIFTTIDTMHRSTAAVHIWTR